MTRVGVGARCSADRLRSRVRAAIHALDAYEAATAARAPAARRGSLAWATAQEIYTRWSLDPSACGALEAARLSGVSQTAALAGPQAGFVTDRTSPPSRARRPQRALSREQSERAAAIRLRPHWAIRAGRRRAHGARAVDLVVREAVREGRPLRHDRGRGAATGRGRLD